MWWLIAQSIWFSVEIEDFSYGLAENESPKGSNIVEIMKNILLELGSKNISPDPQSALRFCSTFLKSVQTQFKLLVDLKLSLIDKKFVNLDCVVLRAPGERSLSFPE